jgi:hypothetical protein
MGNYIGNEKNAFCGGRSKQPSAKMTLVLAVHLNDCQQKPALATKTNHFWPSAQAASLSCSAGPRRQPGDELLPGLCCQPSEPEFLYRRELEFLRSLWAWRSRSSNPTPSRSAWHLPTECSHGVAPRRLCVARLHPRLSLLATMELLKLPAHVSWRVVIAFSTTISGSRWFSWARA